MQNHVDVALKMYAGHSDKTKMLAADLAYNAGTDAIKKGTKFWELAQKGEISQEDYAKLRVYSNGKFTRGLVNRRNLTYAAASGLQGPAPQMVAMAGAQPSTVNNTTNQTVNNNLNVTVKDAKEAKEVIGSYTSGRKSNRRVASGMAA